MKIAIRTDGSKEKGMGHIVRMIAIAKEIENWGAECFFITKPYEEGMELIKSNGLSMFLIDRDIEKRKKSADFIKKLLFLNNCSFLIHDIKDTDFYYMKELKNANILTVNFDDNGSGAKLADMVFDPFVRKENTSLEKRRYYGPEYLILRDDFAADFDYEIRERVKNVFVIAGGTNAGNMLGKIVKWISEMPGSYNVIVLSGINSNIGFSTLYSDHKHSFNIISDWEAAPKLLKKSDIAITSGGISMCEACSLGIPVIAIAQVKHELHNISIFSEENAVVGLGLIDNLDEGIFKSLFARLDKSPSLRKTLSLMAKRMVDGRGKERVVRKIMEFYRTNLEYGYEGMITSQKAALL